MRNELTDVSSVLFLSSYSRRFVAGNARAVYLRRNATPAFYGDVRKGLWEGATVTFVALQLAFHMGFSEAVLIGVDHSFATQGPPNELSFPRATIQITLTLTTLVRAFGGGLPDLPTSEIAYEMAKRAFAEDGRSVIVHDRRRPSGVSRKSTSTPFSVLIDRSQRRPDRGAPTFWRQKPLVSVLTPSFNQGRFLKNFLRTVATQDYPSIEHIVLDGGSTDDSVAILRTWNEKHDIRWLSEPDRGQADAIQRGIAMSSGDIVTWLNSDDFYLHPTVISSAVAAFSRGANVVTAGGWYVSEYGRHTRRIPVRRSRLTHAKLKCVDLGPSARYIR